MNITESEVRQALAFVNYVGLALTSKRADEMQTALINAGLIAVTLKEALARPSAVTPEKPVKTLENPRLQKLFGDCIEGALAFGFQGTNPPPDGHWLWRFWNIGFAEREAKETRLLQDEPGKDARKLSKHLAGKLDARHVVDQNFKDPS